MKRQALTLTLGVVVGCGGQEEIATTADHVLSDYSIVSVTLDPTVSYPLKKEDTVVQVGSDPRNRFTWHRVFHQTHAPRGAVILLSTAYGNFKQQMLGPPGQSLAEKLAINRYEVHGYSSRPSSIPSLGCTTMTVDCSIMSTWGYQAYLDDISFIRSQIDGETVIGGLSTGAGLAMASVNQHPADYAGLIFMDMIVTSSDPIVTTQATAMCTLYTTLVDAGQPADEQFSVIAKTAAQSQLTFALLFGTPTPEFGGTPTFQFFASNLLHTQLSISNFARAQENAFDLNDVESVTMLRDEQCMWAGDTTFTGNLSAFDKPIFTVKQGLAYANYMQPSLDLTSSTEVRVISNPTFGHLDTLGHPNQAAQIQNPLLNWLGTVVFD